jgi:hypothetical protein
MNVSVEVKTTGGRVVKTTDDELHNLVSEGWVSVKDAAEALQKAGIALDKRVYSWLRGIVDPKTHEVSPKLDTPRKQPEPELVSDEAVKALPDAEPKEGA